jgi:hypothetical protein
VADGAVRAWIDLLPKWQTVRARRVDAVVTRQVPNVHKAVKWHGAWYGVPGGRCTRNRDATNVIRWFDIEDPDGNEMRLAQVLTGDTQVTGKRQHMKKATTTMKKSKSGSTEGNGEASPSQLIDARIKELSDWRGETLARVRMLIKQADPDLVEEWKWRGFRCGSTPESSAPVRRTRLS